MPELDAEDQKLVTLARSARARTGAAQGAAVRDGDGRTYVAATVALSTLQLSALQVAVAMAVSSGATALEAAVVLGENATDEDGVEAVREVAPNAVDPSRRRVRRRHVLRPLAPSCAIVCAWTTSPGTVWIRRHRQRAGGRAGRRAVARLPAVRRQLDGCQPRASTAQGYRCLAPNQRGYSRGARPKGRRAYRVPELVEDVRALVDASGAERVHLVGHDWGAAAAWAFAAEHPDRLAGLATLSVPHPAAFLRAMVTSRQGLASWYMYFFQLPWMPERFLIGNGGDRLRRFLLRTASRPRRPGATRRRWRARVRSPRRSTGTARCR